MTTPTAATWVPALLGTSLPDGRVACDLCPHGCVLHPGQSGLCQLRRNEGGKLRTAAFTVTVAQLTAIERKPLYHVWPGSRVLTIAGPGCTFRCDYCINHRLSQYGRSETAAWQGHPADPDSLVARAAAAGALLGMSYTEPSLAIELALALATVAKPAGVPLVWKTNGFLTPVATALVTPVLDAVNIDVKAADDAAHRQLTGAPLAPVWETIAALRAAGVWIEVSTPLVPGTASEPGQWQQIAGTLAGIDPAIPWHLLRFTPDFRMSHHSPTSPDQLAAARAAGLAAGLHYVYVERALGPGGRRTSCPTCGAVLIEREIWDTCVTYLTPGGTCPQCGYSVPGRWNRGQT
jgi:pyruvate formate lyase activating enzyme